MGKKKNRKRQQKKNKRAQKKKMLLQGKKSVWLNVLPHDLWIETEKNTTILKALQKENFDIPGDCGGLGKCGKCKLRVLTSMPLPRDRASLKNLSDEEVRLGIRLACQTKIENDLAVYIGESEPQLDYFQILKTGSAPLLELDPLVSFHEVELHAEQQKDGRSNLELLRTELGDGYKHLEATMTALRSLSGRLQEKAKRGTAVIHRQSHHKTLLAWNPLAKPQQYGLVFDLGTSTLVAKLINLANGQQEAAVSCINSQSKYGADVITRLQHVETHEEGLERLHLLLRQDLNNLVQRLLMVKGLLSEDIFIAVAAGNTTMQHFLVCMDPTGIAEAPFTPVLTEGCVLQASSAGLELHPEALLYLIPTKSGYIGGDMLSVILASQAAEQDEQMILGLDLGTNGEIFLGNRRRLLTCSTAAGPALEGARISSGSIAKAGAIEGVRFQDGILHYKDIGNIRPVSLCGSGLVDLTAVLLNCEVIDKEGLIQPPDKPGMERLRQRVEEQDGVFDFLVASAEETYHGKPIYLTQKDVRELQYAKAAIAAGINILAKELKIELSAIDQVYLAGALGNYVNKYSAIRIGLLPDIDPERIVSLGNAASTGATMVLLSRKYWSRINELAGTIDHVELSERADFSMDFIANMDFPEASGWDRRFCSG